MKALLIVFLVIIVIGGVIGVYFFSATTAKPKAPTDIKSFEDCQAAGFLVVETKPRECHTKTGQTFYEVYNQSLLKDYIEVTDPGPDIVISSPFKLAGSALGSWYQNDQLFVKLIDDKQRILATKSIKALSNTVDNQTVKVPFVAAIDFPSPPPEDEKGTLQIEKTNPNDTQTPNTPLIIPVRFK